jgi:hypothetical protein
MSKKPLTGISRRTMLGAMAAAPVAVPALAKEIASPSPRYGIMRVRGVPATFVGDLTTFGANMGDAIGGTLRLHNPDFIADHTGLDLSKLRDGYLSADKLEIFAPNLATPNRLYGSYINEDGDAV